MPGDGQAERRPTEGCYCVSMDAVPASIEEYLETDYSPDREFVDGTVVGEKVTSVRSRVAWSREMCIILSGATIRDFSSGSNNG